METYEIRRQVISFSHTDIPWWNKKIITQTNNPFQTGKRMGYWGVTGNFKIGGNVWWRSFMLWVGDVSNQGSIVSWEGLPGPLFSKALSFSLGEFLPSLLSSLVTFEEGIGEYIFLKSWKAFLAGALGNKGHFKFQIINLSFKFWFSLVDLWTTTTNITTTTTTNTNVIWIFICLIPISSICQ